MGSEQMRSFFCIMIPGFNSKLQIPSDFVKQNTVILSAKQIKLRTSNGETWDVKLKKMDNGKYFFTKGWNKFAENFVLKIRDFIVFKYSGDSVLDVTMYGITGCENENEITGSSDSDEDESDEDYDLMNNKGGEDWNTESKYENRLYFELCLQPYQEKRLRIGTKFAKAAGLIDKATVKLEYVASRYSEDVTLHKYETERTLMLRLGKGWIEFRKANLEYGATYSFEFKPIKNVVEVKKLHKKN